MSKLGNFAQVVAICKKLDIYGLFSHVECFFKMNLSTLIELSIVQVEWKHVIVRY